MITAIMIDIKHPARLALRFDVGATTEASLSTARERVPIGTKNKENQQ